MKSFDTEVPHQLGKEQAQEKLKSFLENVAEKFKDQVSQLDGSWEDNVLDFSLTTYGFKVKGTLTVEDEVAKLSGTVPLAAVAFKGKIVKGIAKEIERALAADSAAQVDAAAESAAEESAAEESAAEESAAGEPPPEG